MPDAAERGDLLDAVAHEASALLAGRGGNANGRKQDNRTRAGTPRKES